MPPANSTAANTELSIDTVVLDNYSLQYSLYNFQGYVLIDSEIIEFDAIEYQYINKNIINEMLNSHIVILMSEDEGMPLSIIEGMMTGCAIISTDVGCIRDMITEECGYIIERDSQTLAMILSSLEISTIKEMGLRSRERYLDNYSSNMMIKNQISYLNSL